MKVSKLKSAALAGLVLLGNSNLLASESSREIFVSESAQKAIVLIDKQDSVNFAECSYVEQKVVTEECETLGDTDLPKDGEISKQFAQNLRSEIESEISMQKNFDISKEVGGYIAATAAGYVTYKFTKFIWPLPLVGLDKVKNPKFQKAMNSTPGLYGKALYIASLVGLSTAAATYATWKHFDENAQENASELEKTSKEVEALNVDGILSATKTELNSETTMDILSGAIESNMDRIQEQTNEVDGSKFYTFK